MFIRNIEIQYFSILRNINSIRNPLTPKIKFVLISNNIKLEQLYMYFAFPHYLNILISNKFVFNYVYIKRNIKLLIYNCNMQTLINNMMQLQLA